MRILYTVKNIEGEYAILIDQNGKELFIALALLPLGVDVGRRLLFEDLTYRILEE